jgi:phage shock protein E
MLCTPYEFMDLYKNLSTSACLLDVRTKEEYEEGHLVPSLHIPLDSLEETYAFHLNDKMTPIFIYCRSGNRAQKAYHFLKQEGFKDVYVATSCGYLELKDHLIN